MRYFVDSEFIDDGKTIDLLSIALVCEDGREYYAQSVEFDPVKANSWIREHVLRHFTVCHRSGKWNLDQSLYSWQRCEKPECPWRRREEIARELATFIAPDRHAIELVGWCAGYDWVALCQLYGTMMDIPTSWPHYMRDIQQILDIRGIAESTLPQPTGTAHNALDDARHIKAIYECIHKQ